MCLLNSTFVYRILNYKDFFVFLRFLFLWSKFLREVFINSSTRNVNIVENISKLHFNVGVCMTFYEKVIFIFTPLCVIKATVNPNPRLYQGPRRIKSL